MSMAEAGHLLQEQKRLLNNMKTVTEKTHLKKKPKIVSHGTSTNYKARGSMNPTNTKIKQRRKVLTDGGYMMM